MKTSATMIKISQALLLAQRKIEAVTKEGDNPFFKSKYATLPDVIEACKKHLNDVGVLILQPTSKTYVSTVLVHAESGEWVASRTAILCKSPNDPQAQGSAITYARRYGLMSLLFMSAEDDDGNTASAVSIAKPAGHVDNEFKDSICPKCGGKIAISPKGNPFCTGKCYTDWKATQK